MSDAVKVKYSTNFEAVRSRLRRMPKLTQDAAEASIKRDLQNVIKEYQKGLEANNFRLTPLSSFTVQRKRDQGMQKPKAPLYGSGASDKNSLYNALAIRKIKGGWRLYRRKAKHHESGLPLNILLSIHENGAIIKVTAKMRAFLHYIGLHLKKQTTMIRIPPRPIVDKAIQRMLRKKKKHEVAKNIKKAMVKMIKTGNENELRKLGMSEGKKHEAID